MSHKDIVGLYEMWCENCADDELTEFRSVLEHNYKSEAIAEDILNYIVEIQLRQTLKPSVYKKIKELMNGMEINDCV